MGIPHNINYDGGLTNLLVNALADAVQPHCYNYTRLRFLFQCDSLHARAVARRLLNRNPNDLAVKKGYCALLSDSQSDADNEEALKIELDIITHKQDMPNCYGGLGFIYGIIAWRHHSTADYKKALNANQRFLTLTPAYDWRRAMVLRVDAGLEKQIQQGGG